MGIKDNFSAEEWNDLLRAPMLVSYAIAGASPSDQDGFIQEMSAVADAIVEGGQQAAKESLLDRVVADIMANAEDERRGATENIPVSAIKARALDNCRHVASLLQTKASAEEAEAYKLWVLAVAERVAAATKEGGFLGFGGTMVSESEVATLNEIAAALGVRQQT
jgi:hypothetical protein